MARRRELARLALMTLAMTLGSFSSAQARRLSLTLRWAATGHLIGGCPATIVLTPRSSAGSGGTAPLRLEASVPGSLEVEIADETAYQIELLSEGLWAESQTLEPETSLPVILEVRPGGKLRAQINLPPGDPIPGSIALRLRSISSAASEKAFEANLSCPVLQGGLECSVPAGRFDLRLRSEAHTPVYFWDLSIRPNRLEALPAITLQRGASVSGWVAIQDGKPPSPQCQVDLMPEMAEPQEGPAADKRLAGLTLAAKPNSRGFFQVQGVPVGRYRVRASQPGLAQASVGPIDVRLGLESQLTEPLRLAPPIQFRLVVEPPVDSFGRPWTVRLERRSELSAAPKETWTGKPDAQGAWKTPPLVSDTYEISVLDSDSSLWRSEFVSIDSGVPDLFLRIDLVEISGRLLLGKEPLAAEVRLSRAGRSVKFHAGEDGRFGGFLPEVGTWGAEVRSSEGGLALALEEPLEIRVPKGGRRAKVEIVIPDTRLAGDVVDDSGKPVPGARVTVLRNDRKARSSRAETDALGRFLFRGLPAGDLNVIAEEAERESEVRAVRLAEGDPHPDLKLLLRSPRWVAGRIVGPAGPVPGAGIFAYSTTTGLGSGAGQQEQAGADGRFRLRVAGNSPAISLVVMAPGYALHMETVPLALGGAIEVRLDDSGGEIEMETGGGPAPVLVKDGTFLPLQMVDLWARMSSSSSKSVGRILAPHMEAGTYSLCRGSEAISRLRQGQAAPAASCASGVLAPLGRLTLTAPTLATPQPQPGK